MLVLARKLGERVLVPHCDLAVTVIAIEGNTVRLGITAPTAVAVYREELWRQICEQRKAPALPAESSDGKAAGSGQNRITPSSAPIEPGAAVG